MFTSAIFAQESEPVEIDDDDPIAIFVYEIFQALMDEDMEAFVGLYHPESETVPSDIEIGEANAAFEAINILCIIDSIKLLVEIDDLTMVEVEYVGVLYEEEEPPEFNITEDDLLVVQLQLKMLDDDWKIWDAGFLF